MSQQVLIALVSKNNPSEVHENVYFLHRSDADAIESQFVHRQRYNVISWKIIPCSRTFVLRMRALD